MKKLLALLLTALLALGCLSAPVFAAGDVYEGVGQGRIGPIKVAVTLEDGVITAVEVLEHTETVGVCELPIEQIPAAIVAHQSLKIDAVTGATGTSEGILSAVAQALATAGLSAEDYMRDVAKDQTALDIGQRDIIIVGGGMAGMIAAIRAAELGAKVVVFEQASRLGGSALYAGGWIHGAGTKMQAAAGIEGDTPEAIVEDFKRINGEGNFDEALAETHAQKAGEAVDYLQDFVGVQFDGTVSFGSANYPQMSVERIYMGAQGGASYTNALIAKVAEYEQSGDILVALNTEVTEVVLNEQGAASGVVAGGVTYNAPVVIMAAGGYGHNEEWLKRYNFTNVTTSAFATATGSGFDICEALGAKFTAMEYCGAYAGSLPYNGFDNVYKFDANGCYPSVIWVDNTGKRMANEMEQNAGTTAKYWMAAPDNQVYVLFTEDMMLADRSMLIAPTAAGKSPTPEECWKLLAELEAAGNCVFKADTIEELAGKIGLNAEDLRATIDTYNGYCDAGADADFGRTTYLDKFENGPFYALYTVPYVLLTSGGPVTDPQGRLLNAQGDVIPGIFVCGELLGTGNISGELTIGGIGLGACSTFGMISAECAVDYLKTK